MRVIAELRKVKTLIAGRQEREVERLLKVVLKGSPFANRAHAVGGYVRDQQLGIDAKDLDIVVEMKDGADKLTHWLHGMFPGEISRPRQMGANYPIWQITFKSDIEYDDDEYQTKGAVIEFADTMKESFPDEESRQRETQWGTLSDDVERRDFTVNMLLKDLTSGEIRDLTGVSKSDIENGILRGHPGVSLDKIFNDDPLRMIRLVRFHCKYGWSIPKSVLQTVRRNADRIKIVSAERIMEELKKVMKLGKLAKAVRLMKATGLLRYVFPEIEQLRGVKQSPKYHSEGDAYTHTIMVLRNAKPTVEAQMAALLHDVGKAKSTTEIEGMIRSIGHERVGAEIAEAMMRRLKFDSGTTKKVVTVVRNHMRPHQLAKGGGTRALRKFVRDVGDELVEAVLDLAEADSLGKIPSENAIPGLRERVEEARRIPVRGKPVLSGGDIMELLDIEPGPIIGKIVRWLIDYDDKFIERNGRQMNREEAEKAAKMYYGSIK